MALDDQNVEALPAEGDSSDPPYDASVDALVDRRSAPRIRLAIVDDHPLIAEGLRQILSQERDFELVGTAATIRDACALVEEQSPDVVLMDYWLQDGDGADAAEQVLRLRPRTKIVILSGNGESEIIGHALDVGCVGFLSKSRPWNEIADAVRAASRGEAVMQASALNGLRAPRVEEPADDQGLRLTETEMAVLRLLANLRSTSWIATELRLSVDDVARHERAVFTKLGARSIREAVDTARQINLIPLSRFG